MTICLDTNAYSDFKRGDAETVAALERAARIVVPSVVLGELYAGFHGGSRERRNIEELDAFLAVPGVAVEDVTSAIARQYGLLVNELRIRGTPIPTNDIWIAATALHTGAELVTRDEHFDAVPLLTLYR
ncbi:MAG: type II toxin-antitoxin system VapC family toxin [Spirochaeta sp.]|jgi:tRNA(fMet)-specific endonuclease VapC|nr:type II toxin-antitoxin system VapC family toxin [Spirochaeta sp.]